MFSTLSSSHFSHMSLAHARADTALRIICVQFKAIILLFNALVREVAYFKIMKAVKLGYKCFLLKTMNRPRIDFQLKLHI